MTVTVAAGVVLASTAMASAAPRPAPTRPNIILLLADDLGWGDVPGRSTSIDAPHLAQLAKEGMTLERFYSAAPVCSPTRMSLMTGRHPYRTGTFFANVGPLPAGELTLAEILQPLGYRTGFFGKWHLGRVATDPADTPGSYTMDEYSPPWRHGFDTSFATTAKVPTYDPLIAPPKSLPNGHWTPVKPDEPRKSFGTSYWVGEGLRASGDFSGDDSQIIMDRALKFIEGAASQNGPFMACVWFHTPHLPLVAGDEDRAAFVGKDDFTQAHHGAIRALDRQVGRLRAELERMGVADNTLILFMSDNGPEHLTADAPGSAGGLRGVKRSLYEGGIRVPAYALWPGRIAAGSRSDRPVVTSDIMPTLAHLAGVSMPQDRAIDGQDVSPLLLGEASDRATGRAIMFESTRQLALVGDRWKLVHVQREEPGQWSDGVTDAGLPKDWTMEGPLGGAIADYELYDLAADPAETRNVASQNGALVARLRKAIDDWRRSVRRSLTATRQGRVE